MKTETIKKWTVNLFIFGIILDNLLAFPVAADFSISFLYTWNYSFWIWSIEFIFDLSKFINLNFMSAYDLFLLIFLFLLFQIMKSHFLTLQNELRDKLLRGMRVISPHITWMHKMVISSKIWMYGFCFPILAYWSNISPTTVCKCVRLFKHACLTIVRREASSIFPFKILQNYSKMLYGTMQVITRYQDDVGFKRINVNSCRIFSST